MCLYPKLIHNPKYKINKKNGGIIPPINDERVKYVPIGCGVCMECLAKKANEWKVRLKEDIKDHKNGKFVTLTFSNESYAALAKEIKIKEGYTLDNAIATIAVRRFLERWRKEHGKSVRHWLITELGQVNTEHLHLHGIIYTDQKLEDVEKIWKYGWIWKGKKTMKGIENYVSEKTVNYITKYLTKTDTLHKHYVPRILCSKGIGSGYMKRHNSKLNEYKEQGTKTTYTDSKGGKTALPIYYRNKIYKEEEREKLWIETLNKGERWVGGEKIDAENWEEYEAAVKYYRGINKEQGYGSPMDWDVRQYEEMRRKLKQAERGV